MARRRRAHLRVLLNGRQAGTLNRQSSGAIDFAYDPEWLAWEHALPVSLSMPLRETRYIGAPVRAVFDNLLPDNDRSRVYIPMRDVLATLGTGESEGSRPLVQGVQKSIKVDL